MTNVPLELDTHFRAAAAEEGLLDVAYDLVESPLGDLFVGVSDRGLCVISYEADPDAEVERLARNFGSRVLRSPRPVDRARRQLDEYFGGERRRFELDVDLRLARDFGRTVLEELGRVPFGEVTTYGALAAKAGKPKAARAVVKTRPGRTSLSEMIQGIELLAGSVLPSKMVGDRAGYKLFGPADCVFHSEAGS